VVGAGEIAEVLVVYLGGAVEVELGEAVEDVELGVGDLSLDVKISA
jgi:hypothetical protein